MIKSKQTGELLLGKYLRLKSIGHADCKWTKGFWADKFSMCQTSMVPNMGKLLCGDIGHALNNFKIAAGLRKGTHKGMFWHDGDFYKWMEAVVLVYAQTKDSKLLLELDAYIEIIALAQEEDGYLQTQIQLRDDVDRYENRKYHEMYNTGHLLISACTHYKITGKRNFLDIAIKQADLLYTIFFPETKQFGRFGFNQTQIMGLVELYRLTHNRNYLDLATRFILRRGKYKVVHHATTEGYPIGDMVQERTPLSKSSEAVGHAVLALYYYAGAADVVAETGNKVFYKALNKIWNNITHKKMYLTGAVGQTHYGASTSRDKIEEGFIDDYMLPNLTAYNETCANICNALFNFRMLGLNGSSVHVDVIERVIYNSGLSGISLDGTEYFYANPLRMIHNSRTYKNHENATETPKRMPYLDCFCCPPNLVRTIAKISQWAYSKSTEGITVNLYGSNRLRTTLLDDSILKLTQTTEYPWEGLVKIKIEQCRKSAFEMALRIPEWAKGTTIQINGQTIKDKVKPGSFVKIKRRWKKADLITLDMPMEVMLVEGNPRIEEVRNQVAIQRGPVIYCMESPDLPDKTNITDVYIPADQKMKTQHRPQHLGGLTTILAKVLIRKDKPSKMYKSVSKPKWKSIEADFIPYYAWSNRGESEMTVFMPVVWNAPTQN